LIDCLVSQCANRDAAVVELVAALRKYGVRRIHREGCDYLRTKCGCGLVEHNAAVLEIAAKHETK
jgi:hypothetical protein